MEPIPWIVIFPPLAPLQEEAYLPRTTPEDENALSLQTAYEEAYRTVTQFLKRHVLFIFCGPTASSFSDPALTRSLLPIIMSQILGLLGELNSVSPSHLPVRHQIDDFISAHESYGGKKHLRILADNLGTKYFILLCLVPNFIH